MGIKRTPANNAKNKRLAVEIPKDLEAAYSNGAMITHTMSEIVADFIQILPRTKKGKVVSRVIMSPIHAKRLQEVLAQSVANYESQYGEIKTPPTLTDELFRFPNPTDGDASDAPESGDEN